MPGPPFFRAGGAAIPLIAALPPRHCPRRSLADLATAASASAGPLAELRHEVRRLPEPRHVQQAHRTSHRRHRRRLVAGPALPDRRVLPTGNTDDQVRVRTPPDEDDLDPLPAERVVGMRNGDPSQSALQVPGSLLGVSRRSANV
jgi:hypothetical protein